MIFMALLSTYIDSRTNAAIAAAGSTSFAHGLPAAPDLVVVHENATTNTTSGIKLAWASDGTNVSISNHGKNASATLKVVSIYFHSIVR
jgi:hypothetical protein